MKHETDADTSTTDEHTSTTDEHTSTTDEHTSTTDGLINYAPAMPNLSTKNGLLARIRQFF